MLAGPLSAPRGHVAGASLPSSSCCSPRRPVALGGSADVVVYNGRSQYGDEEAFKAFEDRPVSSVELRGGTAPELYERLRSEGADTPADLLVTTDLANLWRAKEAGLLRAGRTRRSSARSPRALRDPDG